MVWVILSPFVRHPLLSRFAHRVGLFTLRQTFVRRRHGGGNRAWWQLNDGRSELLSLELRKGLGVNPVGARGAFPPGDRAPQKRGRAGGASSQARGPNAGGDRRPARATECAKSNHAAGRGGDRPKGRLPWLHAGPPF